jgi:small subunit ribosomal protein S17
MADRGHRRRETGVVVSDAMDKTITVVLRHLVKHPKYGKYVYRSTRCYAHDEKNEAREGDRVEIMETRPLSKKKRWRLVGVVERARL